MRVPAMQGIIDRRILVNYRVDPDVLAHVLPPPFEPKCVHGFGIAGICLIRLKQIRPRFFPAPLGITSENAAHRIAVQWMADGQLREGVYIPRRDTSSHLSTLVGGRLFPGVHHIAKFTVDDQAQAFRVSLRSLDSSVSVAVHAHIAPDLPESSIFTSLQEASSFFESGSLGYSATHQHGQFDGLELHTHNWHVEPLTVTHVQSSFFEDVALFPTGSVTFDCALLMRGIAHEWHDQGQLCCTTPAVTV